MMGRLKVDSFSPVIFHKPFSSGSQRLFMLRTDFHRARTSEASFVEFFTFALFTSARCTSLLDFLPFSFGAFSQANGDFVVSMIDIELLLNIKIMQCPSRIIQNLFSMKVVFKLLTVHNKKHYTFTLNHEFVIILLHHNVIYQRLNLD